MPWQVKGNDHNKWPSVFQIMDADQEYKEAFEGWKINEVGMAGEHEYFANGEWSDSYVEGGLTFFLEKDGKKRVVILGYTELGEWIEFIKDF